MFVLFVVLADIFNWANMFLGPLVEGGGSLWLCFLPILNIGY